MADDARDEADACIEYNRQRAQRIREIPKKFRIGGAYAQDCAEAADLLQLLPDGRIKLVQENSLLRSQLANCHKEIKRLREALLSSCGAVQ